MELQELKTLLEQGVPPSIEVATEEELIEMHKQLDQLYEEQLDEGANKITDPNTVFYGGRKIQLVVKDKKK